MVSRKFLIIFLCLIAAGAIFLWMRHAKNDSEVIRENLSAIGNLISVSPKEPKKPFLAKIREVKKLIATPCILDLDEGGISGSYAPQEITALIERFQSHVIQSRLTFLDIQIHFPDKRAATIHCTGHLKGLTRSREGINEFRELRIEAAKKGEGWRFTRFKTIEALEK